MLKTIRITTANKAVEVTPDGAPHFDVMFKKNMRTNILTMLMVALLMLSGCAILAVKNPTISDVKGKWESTTIGSYSLIQIESESKGWLVMVSDEEHVKSYSLSSFIPKANDIEMNFKGISGEEEPFTVSVSIISGRQVLTDKDDPEIQFWYLRSN